MLIKIRLSNCKTALYGLLATVVILLASPLAGQAVGTRTVNVDGLKIQYLMAGRGPAVLLLHGYAETSQMWLPLIPRLADHFTVIAPDLPGIGDSDIPSDGIDMSHAAIRMHDLVKSLGVGSAVVVGTISG